MTIPTGDFPPRRVLCVGAVVLHDEKVIMVRQTYGGLEGKWSIPWGFVDADEPPEIAAIREAKEEAGIDVSLDGLLGMQNHLIGNDELRLYLIFLCQHKSGEAKPDGLETDQVAYFSLTDLEQNADVIDSFCYWIARRTLRGEHALIPAVDDNPYKPQIAFL